VLGKVRVLAKKDRKTGHPTDVGSLTIDSPTFWIAILKLIWIDLLLSGDNAVVIALACRSLPEKQRRIGIVAGAGAAVGLRILFASIIATIMGIPGLHVVGALLLLWIAVDLVGPGEHAHKPATAAGQTLWHAVRIIVVADAVMSLDNVVAIAAAAHGSVVLIAIGLFLSIPLVIAGSQFVMAAVDRWPAVVWAGAGLLGWVAGELVGDEPVIAARLVGHPWIEMLVLPGGAALFVLAVGAMVRRMNAARSHG
jgi:YjbE family integral membrane protein